jgi:hypothetical protein
MGVGEEDRRIPPEVVLIVAPVLGFLGAFSAWQVAHVVGRRVCGMAYGVSERISVNALGIFWIVVAVVLTVTAGAFLSTARGPVARTVGYLALALFVLGTVAVPVLAAGTCEGIGPVGRYPSGR